MRIVLAEVGNGFPRPVRNSHTGVYSSAQPKDFFKRSCPDENRFTSFSTNSFGRWEFRQAKENMAGIERGWTA